MFAYVSSRLPTFLFLHYFISALSCYEKGSKRKSHLYPFAVFFYKSLDWKSFIWENIVPISFLMVSNWHRLVIFRLYSQTQTTWLQISKELEAENIFQ